MLQEEQALPSSYHLRKGEDNFSKYFAKKIKSPENFARLISIQSAKGKIKEAEKTFAEMKV